MNEWLGEMREKSPEGAIAIDCLHFVRRHGEIGWEFGSHLREIENVRVGSISENGKYRNVHAQRAHGGQRGKSGVAHDYEGVLRKLFWRALLDRLQGSAGIQLLQAFTNTFRSLLITSPLICSYILSSIVLAEEKALLPLIVLNNSIILHMTC